MNRSKLTGKRILVVEDEWFIAKDLARTLQRVGVEVIGPVPTVDDALDLIASHTLDGAVLDVNLRGEMAFPVADALAKRDVPFVLTTGYEPEALPLYFKDARWCGKPMQIDALTAALFPA